MLEDNLRGSKRFVAFLAYARRQLAPALASLTLLRAFFAKNSRLGYFFNAKNPVELRVQNKKRFVAFLAYARRQLASALENKKRVELQALIIKDKFR